MSGIRPPGRYLMDIEIEDSVGNRLDAKPGFLFRFPNRHSERIRISIAVTAELKPAPQLAVMRQKHVGPGGIDQPRRAGHVTDPEVALEAAFVPLHELEESIYRLTLVRVTAAVIVQKVDKLIPVHAAEF